MQKYINSLKSFENKEELPYVWKDSIIVRIHKTGDKMVCNDHRGISLFSTSYKILSNILLSRMTPHANEIIGDYQCGFRRNRSTSTIYLGFGKFLRSRNKIMRYIIYL